MKKISYYFFKKIHIFLLSFLRKFGNENTQEEGSYCDVILCDKLKRSAQDYRLSRAERDLP